MGGLDADCIQAFQRDGFVVTPDLLTPGELAHYGAAIDAAVARRTAGDHRTLAEKSTYEQSFVQCMRLWETNPEIRPLSCHPALARAAAELLGVRAVRLWQDQALYKEPGGRITDPHQDAPFWPIGDAPLVTAWIPLESCRRGEGAMAYVPGSHRAGRLRPVDLMHTTEPYDVLADPALEGREPMFVEAPAGSVVWHHGFTVHQAEANRSDRTRRTFTIVYIADGAHREHRFDAFPLDREGIGVGERIEGPSLPVVWPREGDELPEPPTALGDPVGPQFRVVRS
ncbi:MAG: phytanoyl-CoA dioxygenase family protein [Myxococcota bacterium]|nr:phytanoyl-CoA dioxygenase family protein [Myxococcota bacterium]